MPEPNQPVDHFDVSRLEPWNSSSKIRLQVPGSPAGPPEAEEEPDEPAVEPADEPEEPAVSGVVGAGLVAAGRAPMRLTLMMRTFGRPRRRVPLIVSMRRWTLTLAVMTVVRPRLRA
jgi:hypothetical protein